MPNAERSLKVQTTSCQNTRARPCHHAGVEYSFYFWTGRHLHSSGSWGIHPSRHLGLVLCPRLLVCASSVGHDL